MRGGSKSPLGARTLYLLATLRQDVFTIDQGATDAGLSRGLAGVSGSTVVVNLASSRAAIRDGMATLTPLATHVIRHIAGGDDQAR